MRRACTTNEKLEAAAGALASLVIVDGSSCWPSHFWLRTCDPASGGSLDRRRYRGQAFPAATGNSNLPAAVVANAEYGCALLPQTETDRRSRTALRAVRNTAARTKYRNQDFVRLAGHRAVSLNGTNISARRVTLVTLVTLLAVFALFSVFARGALRALWTLCAGLPLGAGNALRALRALRSGRALRAGITFRARVSAACGERKRDAHDEYRKNPHAKLPICVRPLMAERCGNYASKLLQAPELSDRQKVVCAGAIGPRENQSGEPACPHRALSPPKRLRVEADFLNAFKVICPGQPVLQKYSDFQKAQISSSPVVPPRQQGRIIIGRDAVDAGSATDESTDSGRRRRVVLTSRCWRQVCGSDLQATVAREPITGERAIYRKPSRCLIAKLCL